MNSMIDEQMPPPPIDAWGAFFEHFDKEIAAGRETQESVRAIHERAHDLDWEARFRDTEESAAVEPIKMSPCPFCEGPPCIEGKDFITGKELHLDHPHDEEADQAYSAHVWCHDCGAQGPNIDSVTLSTFEHIYDLSLMDVMRIAAKRWNDRNNKARACYDAGDKEGLNMFPRSAA